MTTWFDISGPAWTTRAACADAADPAAFISDTTLSPFVCATCPVIRECAAQADAQGERSGVWGGVDRRRVN